MSGRVTSNGILNMTGDGTLELLDLGGNVVARFYSRPSDELEAENEKLRELARDWFHLYRDHDDMSYKDMLGTEVVLWQRMCDLGVIEK